MLNQRANFERPAVSWPVGPSEPTRRGCTCGRTHCLKQYCSCFRDAVLCERSRCTCADCHNDGQHEHERIEAVKTVSFRVGKNAPFVKGDALRGCHCRNSKCRKRYCDCFAAGAPCSVSCGCVECENTPPLIEGSFARTGVEDKGHGLLQVRCQLEQLAQDRLYHLEEERLLRLEEQRLKLEEERLKQLVAQQVAPPPTTSPSSFSSVPSCPSSFSSVPSCPLPLSAPSPPVPCKGTEGMEPASHYPAVGDGAGVAAARVVVGLTNGFGLAGGPVSVAFDCQWHALQRLYPLVNL